MSAPYTAPMTTKRLRAARQWQRIAAPVGRFTAELVGTFGLVAAITVAASYMTAAMASSGWPPLLQTMAIVTVVAVAAALVLGALANGLANVSGAHFNPAVSIAAAVAGKCSWFEALINVAGQMVGAVLASLFVGWISKPGVQEIGHLGAPGPVDNASWTGVFVAEALGTMLLMTVILGATDRHASPAAAAQSIGNALGAAILITGPFSSGSLNPARAFAPMWLTGTWTDWTAYMFAPVVGACAASLCYKALFQRVWMPPRP